MNVLFIGDVVGSSGREKVGDILPVLKEEYSIDFTIANGENSAGGVGLTKKTAEELFASGVDVITLGNHSFNRKEVVDIIDHPRVIRPANHPDIVPGKGFCVVAPAKSVEGVKEIAVINFLGRFNMPLVDCPFKTADNVLGNLSKRNPGPPVIIVDFHAELTSEKQAFGHFLDGRVTAVIGTHTHVQTADEKILPGGTAYITDAGMVGSGNSVIGVEKAEVIKRFLTGLPAKFQVAKEDIILNGVVLTIDNKSYKCTEIKRIIR
ncbi:MAG: TIGR00282 family metallophosphoesterase [Elusimicrobia bacterium]|nr:TIGR00282 family metallophosphoesterase [Elusimicrobiota bacterium]